MGINIFKNRFADFMREAMNHKANEYFIEFLLYREW